MTDISGPRWMTGEGAKSIIRRAASEDESSSTSGTDKEYWAQRTDGWRGRSKGKGQEGQRPQFEMIKRQAEVEEKTKI